MISGSEHARSSHGWRTRCAELMLGCMETKHIRDTYRQHYTNNLGVDMSHSRTNMIYFNTFYKFDKLQFYFYKSRCMGESYYFDEIRCRKHETLHFVMLSHYLQCKHIPCVGSVDIIGIDKHTMTVCYIVNNVII